MPTPLHTFRSSTPLPTLMNNPLDYLPHPLCREAMARVEAMIAAMPAEWRDEVGRGKMFGVLLVEGDVPGEVAFLAAYSGQILGRSDWEGFVPAVFDYLAPDGYFRRHEAEISHINARIAALEANEAMREAEKTVARLAHTREAAIARAKADAAEAKQKRDERRAAGPLSADEEAALVRESQHQKAELRRLKRLLALPSELETRVAAWQQEMGELRALRKRLSDSLQQWLFSQFVFANPQGKEANLLDIFAPTRQGTPPAGSGECCEPKLLCYAQRHDLKPLQMAMMWVGQSPKEEIRHAGSYYPACSGKCKPIMEWMLPPEVVAQRATMPLQPADEQAALTEVYDDAWLTVVRKPAGMLSVPGKSEAPSVLSVMRRRHGEAEGPMMVHRLDMATSGLLVVAKTTTAYLRLQRQFEAHEVEKVYVARLDAAADGRTTPPEGTISLPLRADEMDRPRQRVDHAQGREAVTRYRMLGADRVELRPLTGRTHQLRVHCAHGEGLGRPIKGDVLYGTPADRLYLHAQRLAFTHPMTGQRMVFEWKAEF